MNTVNQKKRAITDHLRELVILETRLAIATREAHWNVTGPSFYSLHELFGTQYGIIDGFVDDLAERIRQLGEFVSGSPEQGATEVSSNADGLLISLSEKHQRITELFKRSIRNAQNNGDDGTADLLTGMLEQHDKMNWMLRASVNQKSEAVINIPA